MDNAKPFVQYSIELESLTLRSKSNKEFNFTETLENGRFNYGIFESLVRRLAGLEKATGSDHRDSLGRTYEQKAYPDFEFYPDAKDNFQTSASSTFSANNNGPKINELIKIGDYDSALKICRETGYDKNDFYIYTNSSNFRPIYSFKYIVVPKVVVLENLSPQDPRLISRMKILSLIVDKISLD